MLIREIPGLIHQQGKFGERLGRRPPPPYEDPQQKAAAYAAAAVAARRAPRSAADLLIQLRPRLWPARRACIGPCAMSRDSSRGERC